MTGILTGIAVGVAMIVINTIIGAAIRERQRGKAEARMTQENEQRIHTLEQQADETKALVKLTLGMCVIIGDGMIQSGVNGDVKKAFCEKKQDALKML